jgi:hypothetical protein
MGKDYALFKQPRKAVDIMVTAIKESPHCSDYDAIVAEIIKVITEARKAAAKAVAPEPASVPAKTKITVNSSGP